MPQGIFLIDFMQQCHGEFLKKFLKKIMENVLKFLRKSFQGFHRELLQRTQNSFRNLSGKWSGNISMFPRWLLSNDFLESYPVNFPEFHSGIVERNPSGILRGILEKISLEICSVNSPEIFPGISLEIHSSKKSSW